MCFLLCVSSLVHVSVRVFISLSCVFFSLSTVSTLSTLSIVCTVSRCPGVYVALCFRCLVCLLDVCPVMILFLCVCCVLWFRGGCWLCAARCYCVFRMLFCYCMCVCAACEKRGFSPLQEIYIKKCIFLKNNYCFSCVYEKKAVPL